MIKNKFKLVSILVALLIVGCVSAAPVFAANLEWTADATIDLSSPDIDLTIVSGSTATGLVVNAGTIQPTLVTGETFTVTSASRGLTVSPAVDNNSTYTINTTCTNSVARVVIAGGTSQQFTITPTSSACQGLSGGGGGTPADTTPPTNTSIVIAGGASTTATVNVNLTLSATDATQMQISNDANFTGATWETHVTSRAWTLTSGDGLKTVYARFRDAALNVSASVSDTITLSGSGTVAPPPTPPAPVPPASQAAVMAQLQAQINALILQINALIAAQGGTRPAECSAPLTRQLNFGMRHAEINCLQAYLRANGYLTVTPTGFFGALTRTAIQRFQAEKGIAAQGNAGFGIAGPRTRAAINAALGF